MAEKKKQPERQKLPKSRSLPMEKRHLPPSRLAWLKKHSTKK